MSKSLQAVRGMNDLLPSESYLWLEMESAVQSVLTQYGYRNIRTPIVESTSLFARSIGEHTDIVEKEMYTFQDRNNDSLTLRPEGTASCVRAGIQHGLFYNQVQRLWTMGPMFRHERPQKGRYRQFHQLSVEAYGMKGPAIDAELILLTQRLWQRLGLTEALNLEINTIGSLESRATYREALVEYLNHYKDDLDEDSCRRLNLNPFRILDSKVEKTQRILEDAPVFSSYLDKASLMHHEALLRILEVSNIKYKINDRLVRGLDYYNDTVFEWSTELLGAQSAVCGGGRYDILVEQLGGRPTSAVGFAVGLERMLLLLEKIGSFNHLQEKVDVAIVIMGEVAVPFALKVAEQIRNDIPQIHVLSNCTGSSFKAQMKQVAKSEAKIALLIGEEESSKQQITIKYQYGEYEQQKCLLSELPSILKKSFANDTK